MVLTFTDARQNSRWGDKDKVRVNRVVVTWCGIVTRRACRCPEDAPKTQRRRKVEKDTDVGVWEKVEEEAKRDRIAASVEVYTENIPRRVMLARSSGTTRGRHKFCDRSWRHAAKDFCEDKLPICDTFLKNWNLLLRVIKDVKQIIRKLWYY